MKTADAREVVYSRTHRQQISTKPDTCLSKSCLIMQLWNIKAALPGSKTVPMGPGWGKVASLGQGNPNWILLGTGKTIASYTAPPKSAEF